MNSDRFLTQSLRDDRVARILQAALDAIEPGQLVRKYLEATPLPPHERLVLLGLGKAAEPMVLAAADALPGFARGLIITKRASSPARSGLLVMEAGHPVPDARSVLAGRTALNFVVGLEENDLLLCLISGGGSALATAPQTGIGLRDIQRLTGSLLAAGASIQEINTLRRHLDRIKGGGLARATKARIVSLILSDVIGGRLEAIASGPTVPDPSTGTEALAILDKYEIPVDSNVYAQLSARPVDDTRAFARLTNVIIGNNELATHAALLQAEREGFHAQILQTDLQGEARVAGRRLAKRLKDASAQYERPFCLIAGGETTVTLVGNGKGGRNQELALAAVDVLAGVPDVLLVSLATDGDDGPTGAAGAVATGETQARARAAGMQATDYLARNDSYPFFESLGDLLEPGYTGTNVNDLILLLAL